MITWFPVDCFSVKKGQSSKMSYTDLACHNSDYKKSKKL